MGIIISILSLSFIIFIHEFGHLIASKRLGIAVETFSIGMGKPFVKVHWNGTDYGLSPFPLGGYCKLKGEEKNDEEEAKISPDSYLMAPLWKKVIVLVSGSFMNFLGAFLILLVLATNYVPIPTNSGLIGGVIPNSHAEAIGLKKGDIFLNYFDPITNKTVKINSFDEIVKSKDLGATKFTVEQNGKTRIITLTPTKITDANGVEQELMGIVIGHRKPNAVESIKAASIFFYQGITDTATAFKGLVINPIKTVTKDLVGPIGIVKMTGTVANQAIKETPAQPSSSTPFTVPKFVEYFFIWAMISINLGIMNMLPIPPLDGGKIVEECLSPLLKKNKFIEKGFKAVASLGVLSLLALMIFVYGKDFFQYIIKPLNSLFG